MSWPTELRRALDDQLGGRVTYWRGWDKQLIGPWRTRTGRPAALLLHHTAGASTSSTSASDPGNKRGANAGVVRYVAKHPTFGIPCSSFCLDRDGRLYVMTAWPTYHAGLGDFAGSRWNALGINRNDGNRTLLGVEIVSKGARDDLTDAQWRSLAALARACSTAARWHDTSPIRLPRHRDYAPDRKVDVRAEHARIQAMLRKYPGTAATPKPGKPT